MTNTIELQLIVDDKGTATVKSFSQGSEKQVSSLARTISNKAGGAMRKFGSLAGATLKRVSSLVFSLKTAFIGLAVYGIGRAVSGWEKLSGVQEKAEAGMVAAMKSMGRYTAGFEELIKQTAAGIQSQSTFGDEAVLMGTKFLMTYGNISNESMPRVMKAMTDLAALMKGDFTSAANMLGKASMGMTGELRRAGITVGTNTFKTKGFIGVLEQIEQQVRGQAAALRETKTGGLEAFGNVVGDIKEKFGLFTSTVKSNIARVLLPKVEALNKKLAEWIGSGQMEKDAKRWADAIINAINKIKAKLDPLIEYMQDISDKWKAMGGTGGIASGAGMAGYEKRLEALRAERYGSDAKLNAWLDEHAHDAFKQSWNVPELKSQFGPTDYGRSPAGGIGTPESNEALEIGLKERLSMLTGHHDAAIAIQLAQNQLYAEMELERMNRMKAFSEERISLDQSEHDAALALMQSEQEAYFRAEQAKVDMRRSAVSAAVGLLETLGQENTIAAQAALALNTALSIAEAIQNTAVASTRALAELGPIAGPPAAAAIQAWGAVQIGLIAAQGALKFASSFGKGGTGTPTPVSVGASSTQISTGGGQSADQGFKVIIYGDFYGDEAFVDRLAEKINYAVENRNVRVVSSEII